MTTPFEVNFDFPVAESNLKVSLNATATLHHSEPYYVVQNFRLVTLKPDSVSNRHSVLPDQEIKRVKRGDAHVWVHRDSERESLLSIAIGAAIERKIGIHNVNRDPES